MEAEKKTKQSRSARGRQTRKYTKPRTYEVKLKAVRLYVEDELPAAMVAEEVGVAKATLFKWVSQYEEEGSAGLKPKGYGHRRKRSAPINAAKKKAVELKKQNPDHGSRRISHILRRMFFLKASHETVRKALHEEDLVQKPKRKPRRNPTRPRFFERTTPNQMWQTDIFTFRLGGQNAYLLGFIDDYSRYIVGMGLYRSQTAANLLEVYKRAVGEYNVPREMLTDNGRQYTNWRGESRFEKVLKRDRVKHIKSSPHHPMTLGKIERFWKSIFTEFLERTQFDSFEDAQERLRLWLKYYNHKRPHQGIGGLCPADRFYEIQSELRKVMERGIEENVLETALRGAPQAPFYMVGRMGDQSVVIRAEKGKIRMLVDGEHQSKCTEQIMDLEGEIDEEKEQSNNDRSIATEEERETGVHGTGKMPGGTVDMEREEETRRRMQGAVNQLGSDKPLAEPSHERYDDDAGAQAGEQREQRSCLRPEVREAVRESRTESVEDLEAGEATGGDPVRREEPVVVEQCPTMMRGESYGQEKPGREGRIEESGSHPESAQRCDERDGGIQGVGHIEEDVLQVGETRPVSHDRSVERSPLRATVPASRWRESDYEEGYRRHEEAAFAHGAEDAYTGDPS